MPTLATGPKLLRHFSTAAVFENSVNFYIKILIRLSGLVYLYQQMKSKASEYGYFEDLLARSRILLLNLITFKQIGTSTHFLPYLTQDSKPGKLKIKPLCPKTSYQWSICYIHINTFSIVKYTDPNTTYMENESYLHVTSPISRFKSVDQYYTIFKIKRGHFINQLAFWQNLSKNRTLLVLIVNN